MRFLTCEPNLKQHINYKDESELFDESPEKWFIQNKQSIKSFSFFVIFENYYRRLEEMALDKINTETAAFMSRFSIRKKFEHSFVGQSRRTGKFLYLLNLKELSYTQTSHNNKRHFNQDL